MDSNVIILLIIAGIAIFVGIIALRLGWRKSAGKLFRRWRMNSN